MYRHAMWSRGCRQALTVAILVLIDSQKRHRLRSFSCFPILILFQKRDLALTVIRNRLARLFPVSGLRLRRFQKCNATPHARTPALTNHYNPTSHAGHSPTHRPNRQLE